MRIKVYSCFLLLVCGLARMVAAQPAPTPAPQPLTPAPITVEQLVSNPEAWQHKVVTVRGWYWVGFESSLLMPDRNYPEDFNQLIWLEDLDYIQATEALPHAQPLHFTQAPTRSAEEQKLLQRFRRVQGRSTVGRVALVPVVLMGEFQHEPGAFLGVNHRIIVYKVLELGTPSIVYPSKANPHRKPSTGR